MFYDDETAHTAGGRQRRSGCGRLQSSRCSAWGSPTAARLNLMAKYERLARRAGRAPEM